MNPSLFEGSLVRLRPPDPERDAEVEARWTHDPEYLRLLDFAPARPLSPRMMKKGYAAAQAEGLQHFRFVVRTRAEDRLVGFARIYQLAWTHQAGTLMLGIGAPEDRGRGFGSEALALMLRYAFEELNLHRLTAPTFEYNPRARQFLERVGFVLEVRRRQAIHRDGRRWDALLLGLLRQEWDQRRQAEAPA